MKELLEIANKKGFKKWLEVYAENNHHLIGWIDNDTYLDEVELPDELNLTLIQKWLREMHSIYIWVLPAGTRLPLRAYVSVGFQLDLLTTCQTDSFALFEEALEEGIRFALEKI